ncbi:MAG TPA: phospholipase D-like domain-containing protein [Candidatus Limnocylindria bacterium]|nr:phospholipase D-like domain-containing protein [Candidatus Limnocylindria bacterium]
MSSGSLGGKHDTGYGLYGRPDYYNALAEKIGKTKKGDRIVVATMTLSLKDPFVQRIMHELHTASKRGAFVYMLVDALTFIAYKGFMPKYPLHLKQWATSARSREVQSLQKLAKLGGYYSILNWPERSQVNPFAHRSHLKFAVVGNSVFLGGANLTTSTVTDCIVGWEDAASADWLFGQATEIAAEKDVSRALDLHDVVFPISDSSQILLDAGLKRQSMILQRALGLVDAAKREVWITSQFFPNGRMARHLSEAISRGVHVRAFYNSPAKHNPLIAAWQRAVIATAQRALSPDLFTNQLPSQSDFLHAKVLATERSVMIGSHNYLDKGVMFGTAEIALQSNDPRLHKQTMDMLKKLA